MEPVNKKVPYNKELPYFEYQKTESEKIFELLKDKFNIQKYKEFIKSKNKYLQEYRTLSEKEFLDLFKWTWKYNKSEIKQNNRLWLCYAYTWFEMLKKTIFFNELIQTNMKSNWVWKREVRIPFNSKWYRMKVSQEEIDKNYSFIPRKWWKEKKVRVNTESSLGFKILEIAFLKSYFLFNPRYSQVDQSINDRNHFQEAWDIEITPELLRSLECWNTRSFLQHILWEDVVMWNDSDEDKVDKNSAIKYFKTWCIKISLWLPPESKNMEFEYLNILDKKRQWNSKKRQCKLWKTKEEILFLI